MRRRDQVAELVVGEAELDDLLLVLDRVADAVADAGKPSPGVPAKRTSPTRSADVTVRMVLPTTHGFSRERSRRAPS